MKLYKLIKVVDEDQKVFISGMQMIDGNFKTYYSGRAENIPIYLAGLEVNDIRAMDQNNFDITVDDEEE